MTRFESVEDVTEWLAPMGYDAFWHAVAPLNLFSESERAHCDRTIADGVSPYDTVLSVMKGIVRMELTERYGLKYRLCIAPTPRLTVVE